MKSKDTCIIVYPHIGEYGGIERNIVGLATEVLRQGHIPVLLCYYDHIKMDQYVKGLVVVQLGDHWSPFVKGKRLKDWILKNQDSMRGMPFMFSSKAGFYAYLSGYRPYVLHYTDPPSLLAPSASPPSFVRQYISDWLIGRGVKDGAVLLTMTKWNAKELEQLYGRPFDVVYQGGVPSPAVEGHKRALTSTLRLFSISRIFASKNLDWILNAGRFLLDDPWFRENYKNLEIVIAGKGPDLDRLTGMTKELALERYVSFPGFVSMEQQEQEYSNADLFLVPGRQGYGLPILEALYRQVPVVMNVESRVSEILTPNPWVGISENNSKSFSLTLLTYLKSLKKQYPTSEPLADLPTEPSWALEIGKRCSWWPA
jgi:glycosyltransferase involved in cell wall biosynthesis